ncbi:MAG TPA: hypothetical protein PLB89_05080 [Flavobacteriales bacterium]|nr:hypothetical protein [Flavobacteriales bacterium]
MAKKKPLPDLVVKPDFIEPDLGKNGRWSYGFGDLEVGDQMRCPRTDGESVGHSGARVQSAAIAWKTKNYAKERAHLQFRIQTRAKYVLLERVA